MVATHRKGSRWRLDVQKWLESWEWMTRFRSVGEAGDDITAERGLPHVNLRLSIECKNHKTITLAAFVDQAVGNASAYEIPVTVIKRRGKASVDDAYFVLTGRDLRRLVERFD